MTLTGRQLRSTLNRDGKLTLSLETVVFDDPTDDEVVVRIEATPINPTDVGLLFGSADLSTLTRTGGPGSAVTLSVPSARLARAGTRLGRSMPVGSEGAGTVIAAGRNASALTGKRVSMMGGSMYADYRRIAAQEVVPLPEGISAADGASMFINPLTALGFVETARREGHKAIVHTAAASNLGQMLVQICLTDGIPLVNIVRSQQQVDLLCGIGAVHVLNSRDEDFAARLADVLEATGATVAFDAIGGGRLGSDIIGTMERLAVRSMVDDYYGSDTFKQLYAYGGLDSGPMTLSLAAFGSAWSVSGWLLFPFLRKVGREVEERLRQRVVNELRTTFASRYARIISLAEMLEPDVLRDAARLATGGKFLIDPTRG